MRSLALLRVQELILHSVPSASRGEDNPPPVQLSQAPVDLADREKRNYFQSRLRSALGGFAREVVQAEGASDVPDWIRAWLQDGERGFVDLSQRLALKLREVQTGANNAGLLLAARCTWDGSPSLLVAKVELERAAQATPVTVDGRLTYSIDLLDDLVFGQHSRVFKVGVFCAPDVDDAGRLSGWAIDRQASGPDLAGYFLNDYLGCEYAMRPEVTTKKFFDAAEHWINQIDDAERRAKYEVALLAEMQSASPEVSIDEFSRRAIEPADRDSFTSGVLQAVPSRRFDKSTKLVPIRRVKIETSRGVQVYADPVLVDGGSDAIVRVESAQVTVRDKVIGLTGNGRGRIPRSQEAIEGDA